MENNNFQPIIDQPLNAGEQSDIQKSEKLGTASMVLGIISLVINVLSFPIALTGLILGIVNKKQGGKKKSGIVMNAIAIGLSAIFITIIGVTTLTSKKMHCTSSRGDITIMYNDKELTGYAANGVSYDLDSQKEYANEIGVEKYLDEFKEFFEVKSDGRCSR